ncbi:Ran-interacting Mog1 protein [Gracilaria domingensis]|nr:Ran-interacting Mog1 protein [Gracilaria domingensis]
MVGSKSSEDQRSLFGGAITTIIPAEFADVSKIRPIPDNQEVFSHAETDRSVIVEILELDTSIPSDAHQTPASHHFSIIAHDSSATRCSLSFTQQLHTTNYPGLRGGDDNLSISFAQGQHVVSKFRDKEMFANTVNVYVVCIRLPRSTTDILISFNDPVSLHPQSSSTRMGSTVADPQQTDLSVRSAILQQVLDSFVIHDWGLFQ